MVSRVAAPAARMVIEPADSAHADQVHADSALASPDSFRRAREQAAPGDAGRTFAADGILRVDPSAAPTAGPKLRGVTVDDPRAPMAASPPIAAGASPMRGAGHRAVAG